MKSKMRGAMLQANTGIILALAFLHSIFLSAYIRAFLLLDRWPLPSMDDPYSIGWSPGRKFVGLIVLGEFSLVFLCFVNGMAIILFLPKTDRIRGGFGVLAGVVFFWGERIVPAVSWWLD